MLPFLRLHALAATRGDGLRPELRRLFERLTSVKEPASPAAMADDEHPANIMSFPSNLVPGQETAGERDPKP